MNIEPDDSERFVQFQMQAIQVCKPVPKREQWDSEFREFLTLLHDWSEQHSTSIQSAFLDIGDGYLIVYLVTRTPEYDSPLDDLITEFDLSLAAKFPWIRAELMQLTGPVENCSISFEKGVLVYGDGK